MEPTVPTAHLAVRIATAVNEHGRIEFAVPFAPGTQVVVFVVQEAPGDDFSDLLAASTSTLGFWDNEFDEQEPVLGMWADRADMADGAAFVRSLRRGEWNRHHGTDPAEET